MLLTRWSAYGRRSARACVHAAAIGTCAFTWSAAATAAGTRATTPVVSAAVAKHLKPLPTATVMLHAEAGVSLTDPVYFRIFKEESELEVWRGRSDGRYVHVRTYPICTFSGQLGPKTRYADYQAPEGFYAVTARQLKPDSSYHLAFNVGYPNALDRTLGRTGDLIMVHGKCKSVGCFAMTDGPMEEIYALARDALNAGQASIPVHSFPFRMTEANIARHAGHRAAATWAPLIDAYRDFEVLRTPPQVAMCGRRYVVNPVWSGGQPQLTHAAAPCPEYRRIGTPAVDDSDAELTRRATLLAQGPKQRTPQNLAEWGQTRVRTVAALQEQRRLRRERFRSLMAARDQLDPHLRMNLGMSVGRSVQAD